MKTVIKGLINRSRVKLEYVQAIAEALGNDEINQSYWEDIFNGQGAEDALKQGIYSPQIVRVLTLRAIVIPQTLAEYLAWLENGNKQNENYTVSAEFQSQIRNSLTQITHVAKNIEFNITEGIRLLLPKLLEQKVTVEAVVWLLTTQHGLWAKFHYKVIQEIEDDLQLMSQLIIGYKDLPFKLTNDTWQRIWNEIKIYWKPGSYEPQEKYQKFAVFFTHLGYFKLAALFYQISFGEVPKKLFYQACSTCTFQSRIYKLTIIKKMTVVEKVYFTFIGNNLLFVPIAFFITYLFIIMLVSYAIFTFFPSPYTYWVLISPFCIYLILTLFKTIQI